MIKPNLNTVQVFNRAYQMIHQVIMQLHLEEQFTEFEESTLTFSINGS